MDQVTFDKEIAMCQKLSKESGGKCCWGECEKCGVIPLLYKLSQGKIVEGETEVKELKQSTLKF